MTADEKLTRIAEIIGVQKNAEEDTGAYDFRVRSAKEFVERFGDETEFYTCKLFDTRDEWLAGRRDYIGASEAFKILDTEERKKLFEIKTGKRERENLDQVKIVWQGRVGEDTLRKQLAIDNLDWEFFDGSNLLFISKRKPFMSASLDCIAVHRDTGEMVDIEIKYVPWSNKWRGEFAPDGYFTQLMHQSFVTGITRCVLHPRIALTHDGGLATSFTRMYDYDMTDPAITEQIDALVAEEELFHVELERGVYTPTLSIF